MANTEHKLKDLSSWKIGGAGIQMRPDLLEKRLRAGTSERCVILCAYFGEALELEHAQVIRGALNELDTDGWWFFNPGTFIVAFRSSRNAAERAGECEARLIKFAQEVPQFAHMGIGSAEGPALSNIADGAYLDTPPIGNVVNEAFVKARKNAN